jgi:hypothetical protein
MSEFLKIAVVVLMAIPFIYMFYDVTQDLIKKLYLVITKKAKPVVISVISSLFN